MKNIFYLSFLVLSMTLFSEAATRGDVKVIEASENIRYLSQKMVKDYLLFYLNQNKTKLKSELENTLKHLNDNLRMIAMTTKDSDTKDVLEFLAYSKDQLEEIFKGEADNEKVVLMMDYSEILLEGADSIATAHTYAFSNEEKMLMVTKEMEYLLQRIIKYYMALNAGFNNPTNREQLLDSITDMQKNIEQINRYSYKNELLGRKNELNRSWRANKHFFIQSESLFIPMLMLASIKYMEEVIQKIALYHTQNL